MVPASSVQQPTRPAVGQLDTTIAPTAELVQSGTSNMESDTPSPESLVT